MAKTGLSGIVKPMTPKSNKNQFCNQCGVPFAPVCSACGHENTADAKFCNQCATPLMTDLSTADPSHSIKQGIETESRFQTLIPGVMWLLQRDRRITYRTLKYAFGLDEPLLEGIREELILIGVARDRSIRPFLRFS